MNKELNAEVLSDPPETPVMSMEVESSEPHVTEYPFYIVPRPPMPGKTSWSSTAW
ncbi:MAG: hypothetical protein H6R26_251 [Proteobacteria bacterium]|nr:hypothetical protein [Pseudomonadota bacterium]